jgi:membrane associated rhomboid family serine protease
MNKLVALVCVISWSGFWAFGYLALSADVQDQSQVMVAALLAAFGFLTGVFAYIKLSRDHPADYTRAEQG